MAGPLGQMLRCRVTAGEGTDIPERSAARGGVDIDLLQGDRRFESRLLQRRVINELFRRRWASMGFRDGSHGSETPKSATRLSPAVLKIRPRP